MKKLFFASLILFFIAGCGKQGNDSIISTGTVQGFTTSYVVGSSPVSQKTLYGTVIADSIKTILTNRGGILEYINCQPGKQVYKNTIIAKIQANPDDVTYQNSSIQLSTLQEQLNNLTTIFSMTEDTLALQKTILNDQYTNNITLLNNLDKSQAYSASSIQYQEQLLDQQYDSLKTAKTIDLDKMKTSISTAYKQYIIMVKDALKKVNDVFASSTLSVSDKNLQLKQQVIAEYSRLSNKLFDTMTADQFSQYLSDMSDFMTLAASSINASTPSSSLPQASSAGLSIDGLYTLYTTLATTFMGSKSAFDALASSYDSVKNTYTTQIKSADINTANLENNTAKSTALQLENQKASIQLAQKTLQTQLASAADNQEIQLASLKNQVLTLKQNIVVLSNSLDGEILYAGVDGVVKMRAIGEDNKVSPNTLLCQISPMNPGNLSLQIFSYQQLPLGSKVSIFTDQGQFLGTGVLIYEYPYKDPATQNYIYEIPVINFSLKENEKVLVVFLQLTDQNQIRIPLQYISPRLEGNLVRRKAGSNVENVYVNLGDIDDSYVQILSGLNIGDTIVN
ncbi:MAG: efflux RND transporter periplasmic adaptor subunit [Candidatus Absconditabacterales bacterium]